jgi:malate permease and related proteins
VSFVGFPIFELLYGEAGMKAAVLMSQAGSFLVCSTLGVFLATVYSATNFPKTDSFREVQILQSILRFPPFLAFCVALFVNLSGFTLPEVVVELLRKLAAPFSFLALVSVGMQMDFKGKNLQWQQLKWGLGYKLFIAPLMVLICVLVTHQKGMIAEMCVLGAALGPMNTVAIIASNFGLNPKLATQMIGLGIPLSLITTALWYGVLWILNFW